MKISLSSTEFMALAASARSRGESDALDLKAIEIILDAINKADKTHDSFIASPLARTKDCYEKRNEYESNEHRTGVLPLYASIRTNYRKSSVDSKVLLQKKVMGTFKDVLPVEQYFEDAKTLEDEFDTLSEFRHFLEEEYFIAKATFMLLGRKSESRGEVRDGGDPGDDVQDDDVQDGDFDDHISNRSNVNDSDANDTVVAEVSTDRATNSTIVPRHASRGNFLELARTFAATGTSTNINFMSIDTIGAGGCIIGGNGGNVQRSDIYEAARAGARDGARDGAERAVARSIKKSQAPASNQKVKDGLNLEDYFSKNNVNAVASPIVENVDSDSDDADDVYNYFEEQENRVATNKKPTKAAAPRKPAAKETAVEAKGNAVDAKPAAKNDMPTCAAIKKDGKPCTYRAKFEQDGVHYCGNHLPGK